MDSLRLLQGDALTELRKLPADSVHCCVTSPPYWGLRAYGTEPLIWGGAGDCEHAWSGELRAPWASELPGPNGVNKNLRAGNRDRARASGAFCALCGAWRGDLGLEPTIDLFVTHLVEVFREVRRVLRPDGTLWLNIGDSYAGSWGNYGARRGRQRSRISARWHRPAYEDAQAGWDGLPPTAVVPGLKNKDLCMIPARVALALQADGWWLRSVIIWEKPSTLPESVRDRPTTSHEYVYLLAKSETYFYDAEAIKEPSTGNAHSRGRGVNPKSIAGGYAPAQRQPNSARLHRAPLGGLSLRASGPQESRQNVSWSSATTEVVEYRNKRTVWSIPAAGFPGAHFACVDGETECLTKQGWKRHTDLLPGMLAAQLDLTTGLLGWAPIEDVARYEVHDQPMVVAKSRDVEMLLTPNHRTIISRRSNDKRQWQPLTVIRADEMKPSHAIPVSAKWEPCGDEPMTPDWAELLGWYLAEGCETSHSWAVEIYQSRSANPAKVDRIRELLETAGAKYTEAVATRQRRGQPSMLVAFQVRGFAAAYLRQWAPGKRFHPDTLGWSDRILECLLNGLVDGDGHRRPDGRISFVQRDKGMADTAQAIAVRLGYATMLSPRSGNTYGLYLTHKRLISFRGTAGEGTEITQRPYTGTVWCPKLPAGTWVARKNGRAFFTGNTYPPDLVRPCVLAGTSERGCCPTCGAPWERVVARTRIQKTAEYAGKWSTSDGQASGRRMLINMRAARVATGVHNNPFSALRSNIGWRPTCDHYDELYRAFPPARCQRKRWQRARSGDWWRRVRLRPGGADWPTVPALVLDPFSGAGTTGLVALREGRHYLGIELNPEYNRLAEDRIRTALEYPTPPSAEPADDSQLAFSQLSLW